MKKIKIILLLLVTFNNHFFENTTHKNYESSKNELIVIEPPYLNILSLGDDLFTEGLVLEYQKKLINTEGVVFEGFNPLNLGNQKIDAVYEGSRAEFEIYVTNDLVNNYLPIGDIFISEFVYLNYNQIAIELYNNSDKNIFLDNYKLLLKNVNSEVIIELNNLYIEKKQPITIANFLNNFIEGNVIDFTINNILEVNLIKQNTVNDILIINTETSEQYAIRRHYNVYKSNELFNIREWINTGIDLSNIGSHYISNSIITIEEQAKAFARYVLFGAGMFAAGRYKEAFNMLKTEYELMSFETQEYFIKNKRAKVQGYNEEGKYITLSFEEAHSRIALLASRSGNKSFLPQKSGLNFDLKNQIFILITSIFISLSIIIYFIIRKHCNILSLY